MSSLHRLLNGLRYVGVGTKVGRNIYKFPDTYWVVTRVKLSKDQNHGTIHGRLVWRGKSKPEDRRINSALKKQWSILELPNYRNFKGKPDEVAKLFPDPSLERTC